MREINSIGRGDALALNRRNSLPCILHSFYFHVSNMISVKSHNFKGITKECKPSDRYDTNTDIFFLQLFRNTANIQCVEMLLL